MGVLRKSCRFQGAADIPSLPLALSSKDKLSCSGVRLFLPLICHWDPGVAPVSPSQVADLAIGWKATKGKETPSKYNKVKTSALENSGRKRQKKGTKEIILACFYSWRPEAQSWALHSDNLCKTTSSLRSMVGWRPLHWVQQQRFHHMGWYKPNHSVKSCCSYTCVALKPSQMGEKLSFVHGDGMFLSFQAS